MKMIRLKFTDRGFITFISPVEHHDCNHSPSPFKSLTSSSSPWRTILICLGVFLTFFVGLALIQFSTPDLPDNDGFYHIKLAEIMRTEGLRPAFPWLPLTILNAREYYDHHFLFHVALIPFTFGDLRLGAKWAAVTFASLAFFIHLVAAAQPAGAFRFPVGIRAAGSLGGISSTGCRSHVPNRFPWRSWCWDCTGA